MKKRIFSVFLLILIVSLVFLTFFVSADDERVIVKFKGSGQTLENNKAPLEGEIKVDLGNVVSMDLNESEIRTLNESGKVEFITKTKFELMLQHSVPLINGSVVQSRQYNGINLTGKGQTVCIIDSGIDYSNPTLGGCYGNNNPASSCKVLGGYDFYNTDSDPMDDYGHGTHVAGIIAASGGITGVAPEAKLIAIKACNNRNGCDDAAVAEGIRWCIQNATIFNITVISMSLGSVSAYTSNCDFQDDVVGMTIAVNNATLHNISVIAATGNQGYANAISQPACLSNVTPVTASTNADDEISGYANVASFVLLAAPGDSINSTCISSDSATGYCVKSGTSMATPHVSGAFVLLKQYLSLTNRFRTGKQIESILNLTGKLIYEPVSNKNYSRINVLAAIESLSPRVALISPGNYSHVILNQSYLCNVSSLTSLKNLTFLFYNSSGQESNRSIPISGTSNS
ncbi:MAG: S8 family serine peptidase, partial [archaeon]